MSDAYERDAFNNNDRCGCGAGLSRFAVRVVHAETGVLLTRLCRRCAADLAAPPLPPAESQAAG
jgi:hypothetical protein